MKTKIIIMLVSVVILGTLVYVLTHDSKQKNLIENEVVQNEKEKEYNPSPETGKASMIGEEDIITLFFSLIDERRIAEAIGMMSEELAPDDTYRQSWGVHFNSIESVRVKDIYPSGIDSWTDNAHQYKVELEIYLNSKSENAPIPYYGWGDNPNYRWVNLTKNGDGVWKISSISTGP